MNKNSSRLGYLAARGMMLITLVAAGFLVLGFLYMNYLESTGWEEWIPAKTCYYPADVNVITLVGLVAFMVLVRNFFRSCQ